ncbi:MAG: hypothetical protein Kow00105_17800 [Phycisphaeraceae bacterium]
MPLDQIDHEPKRRPHNRPEEVRMSFGDHIEELRRRLILALLGPLLMSVFGLIYGKEIVGWLVKPLTQVLLHFKLPPQTYTLAVTTGFGIYMKVGLIVGLVLSAPWVIYQLWKFVESGLYEHEKRAVYWVAPFSAVMSVLGVLFLYYILLPMTLAFLIFFTIGFPPPDTSGPSESGLVSWALKAYGDGGSAEDESPDAASSEADPGIVRLPILDADPPDPVVGQAWIKRPEGHLRVRVSETRTDSFIPLVGQSMLAPMIEIGQYISFVTMLMLAVVVSFQLPVVMMIVGWTGLVAPAWLAKYRRYCIFVCFVLGALLTPADPISMFALALPLWGLFELGLLVMRMGYKERKEPADAGEP